MINKFPFYKQSETKDCGPTCIKIISKFYGKVISIEKIRSLTQNNREGSSLSNLSSCCEMIGFRTLPVKVSLEQITEAPFPCIIHWNNNHFVVLYKIKSGKIYVADPGIGLMEYSSSEFVQKWIGNNANKNTEEGIALLIEPTNVFYKNEDDQKNHKSLFTKKIANYLIKYKSFLFQLILGLAAATAIQITVPFLTQSIVDVGIKNQNLKFIYLILFAQLCLFVASTALDFIRSWILLHLSTRINISIISDFFIKLMNLPIQFFDARMTGDILQRIQDHHRIEKLLTSSSLNVLFSILNIIIMGAILAYYNLSILLIFFIGSALYFFWILLFLKKREKLDYKRFAEISAEQSKVIELINGMQEIKLHNAEKQKRWSWEFIQARLFKISVTNLTLEQTQNIGSRFINELKNIIIIFLSVKLVIEGQITLGMMMAISSIVGTLNTPILQIVEFIREFQDAKIAVTRLSEIHDKEDETDNIEQKISEVPTNQDIHLNDVSFKYFGSENYVLKNLNLTIPSGKITAIVGSSGSGKTTLMKLLLKFYDPIAGTLQIGKTDLSKLNQNSWRDYVGTVMQEGYIFNDTIANNIALGIDYIDKDKLLYASEVANINEIVDSLPLGFNTKIGVEGVGLSTGQKQRILIARAVYKDPNMLLFDEATSALDANNEKSIMEKLNSFFFSKTVVIIAHRLSTVMNADNIVVLEKGSIIEVGTHASLISKKGNYYQLVKNQLQLGE
jgi:ATP-binding cassette subfamily B protein